MIPLSEITRFAHKYNVAAETIEKDYVISWILLCISKSLLKDTFIFYGGTAIKRIYFEEHRFSEDIDLLSTHKFSLDQLVEALDCLQYAKTEANLMFGINQNNILAKKNRAQLYVNYSGYDEIIGAPKEIRLDFAMVQKSVYKPNHFSLSEAQMEDESAEYSAAQFNINGFNARFRVAKITPTKIGQFVTIWKRKDNGPIQPFDQSDPIDLFIIATRYGNHFGHFVFPKSVLINHDIVSIEGKGGKRGIRVYPPWDVTTSRQAQKTQQWQLVYFIEIPQDGKIDIERVKKLYLL